MASPAQIRHNPSWCHLRSRWDIPGCHPVRDFIWLRFWHYFRKEPVCGFGGPGQTDVCRHQGVRQRNRRRAERDDIIHDLGRRQRHLLRCHRHHHHRWEHAILVPFALKTKVFISKGKLMLCRWNWGFVVSKPFSTQALSFVPNSCWFVHSVFLRIKMGFSKNT